VRIGGAKDPAEARADAMAATVLSGGTVGPVPAAPVAAHRECAECAEEKELKRAPAGGAAIAPGTKSATAGSAAREAIKALGPGRPLAPRDRAFFEPRFGRDLSSVRIHEGVAAHKASRSIDARAFAYGNDIAFANGERAKSGQKLMAHELAHVVQDEKGAHRTVHRACHDGKCGKCAGGVKKLDISFLYRSKIDKKSLGPVVKDFMRSQKVLKNCCIKMVGHFDLQKQLPGDKVVSAPKARTSGKHKGTLDYGNKIRATALSNDVKKAKGTPVLVVNEVKGTGGGMTVTRKADPRMGGRDYIFFALKNTNSNCATIAHELYHQAGGLNHNVANGEIVACKSDKVAKPYCEKVRGLA
jgi:hypothetical protein